MGGLNLKRSDWWFKGKDRWRWKCKGKIILVNRVFDGNRMESLRIVMN